MRYRPVALIAGASVVVAVLATLEPAPASASPAGARGSAAPASASPAPLGSTASSALAAGGGHACAVLAGSVRCWGVNSFEQLGDAAVAASAVPVAVPGTTSARAVAAGGAHSCALLADGTVRCWGGNESGQLWSAGVRRSTAVPQAIPDISDATAITAGLWHTCALLARGAVACWGGDEVASTLTGYRVVGRNGVWTVGDCGLLGSARLTVEPSLDAPTAPLCYRLATANAAAPATGADLRAAAIGKTGPRLRALEAPDRDGRSPACVTVTRNQAVDLALHPGDCAVTVLDAGHPDGAVRGNLARRELEGALSGAMLSPVAATEGPDVARGAATLTTTGRELCYQVVALGVTGATAVHLHGGPEGYPERVVVFPAFTRRGNASGCLEPGNVEPSLLADLVAHPTHYRVEVHTLAWPDGGLQGTVVGLD